MAVYFRIPPKKDGEVDPEDIKKAEKMVELGRSYGWESDMNTDPNVEINVTTSPYVSLENKILINLLKLSDNERKTAKVLIKYPNGISAEEVANETGRSRPTESKILNELELGGYVTKKPVGNKIYYTPTKELLGE